LSRERNLANKAIFFRIKKKKTKKYKIFGPWLFVLILAKKPTNIDQDGF